MSQNKPTVFCGVATALITPFCKGKIDFDALDRMIEMQIESGIDALLVAGTTGESATLTVQEHHALVSFAKERIGGRVPLLAGCGANSTAHAISLAEGASAAGADALLCVTPYYNKASPRGLLLHYRAIADRATRPVILYNVPSRTGVSLGMETYRSLAKHPNIVAVKEASGDLSLIEALASECYKDLDVYTGNDDQLVPAMKLGARGVISVYSNIDPTGMTELYRLCLNGAYRKAEELRLRLAPRIHSLFWEVNPIPVKFLASRMGLCAPEYRLPLCPPSPETVRRLEGFFGE